jgi:hypothetical protein
MADGAKFSTNAAAPDYNLNLSIPGGWGSTNYGPYGNFSDFGPWYMTTSAYDRSKAPGNSGAGTVDARIFAFRHGGMRNGNFRLAAVFFDGHAEVLEELEAANPRLWLPKGVTFPSGVLSKIWPDVKARYNVINGYFVD